MRVRAVSMEATANVVVNAAVRHGLQCKQCHITSFAGAIHPTSAIRCVFGEKLRHLGRAGGLDVQVFEAAGKSRCIQTFELFDRRNAVLNFVVRE